MSSADRHLPLGKRTEARTYVLRSGVRILLLLGALDLILALCFAAPLWGWLVLIGAELVGLGLHLWRTDRNVRAILSPLGTLREVAENLKDSSLDADELRRLSRKLEQVDAASMAQQVAIAGGGQELAQLARSINDMLKRIDRRYQAQVRFTSDASHELRTPISVIQGYANLLDRWGKDNPQIRQEAIDAIRQEADAMAQLVEQLLFLVRGDNDTQKVDFQMLDLSELVLTVAKETDLVDDTHEVRADVEPEVVCVADRALVKQCLRVLCDNALKYTPEGGSVTIGLRRDGDWAEMRVQDTGVGISQEDLPHVFERFYRSDLSRNRATGGTGLGLAIAAWIAQRHGGKLSVESVLGEGSTFLLRIPLTGPTMEEAMEGNASL
jgi:signal transduction histidine kinase